MKGIFHCLQDCFTRSRSTSRSFDGLWYRDFAQIPLSQGDTYPLMIDAGLTVNLSPFLLSITHVGSLAQVSGAILLRHQAVSIEINI